MILLPLLILAAAQRADHSTDRLPPADPLPLSSDGAAAEVLATVQRMLAGLAARDPAAILADVRADGGATAVTADGVHHYGWAEFAARIKPGSQRYEERLSDPAVEVDDNIAMVWSPYQFRIDGRVDHCGTDHFDLVREGGRWRVLNVTWTQRTDCEPPSSSRP
ncbi:nuclear transport factor 2 family protein [uncultured Sphingomonas sp.]|uniref:nuclear transport factor 2 family protein n=1 Tax=uncultured Sphingomonas sp. TaxID=158754 RepID=UPI0035CAC933